MNFKPRNVFIGLLVSFSILLPRAPQTWLLMGEAGQAELGDLYASLDCAQASAGILFASHLCGHPVSLLGSWLQELYDWARRDTQITLLARRGRSLRWLGHALKGLEFKGKASLARAQPFVRQKPIVLQVKYFVVFTAS